MFTANSLRSFKKVPEIYFVFNQSNVNNEKIVDTLHVQVRKMNSNILGGIEHSG